MPSTNPHYLITTIRSSTQIQALVLVTSSVGAVPSAKEKTGTENPAVEESLIQMEAPPWVILPMPSSRHYSPVSRILCAALSPVHDSLLVRASSVAPTENPSTPSLPGTPRQPSGRSSSATQTNAPTHLVSLSVMWSPRGSAAPDRRREGSLLHDLGSEQ